MYKPDKQRIEDALIPYIIHSLFLSQIKQQPEKEALFDKAIALVSGDIEANIGRDTKLQRRLDRAARGVLSYFREWPCRKAHMVVSYLAAALQNAEAVCLGDGTKEVVRDIDEIIVNGYAEIDGLDLQDKSASKHVPKVLKVLQGQDYF